MHALFTGGEAKGIETAKQLRAVQSERCQHQRDFLLGRQGQSRGSGPGSAMATVSITRHALAAWAPALKFLGMGLLLAAVTVAVTVVVRTGQFQEHTPSGYADQIANMRC